MGSIRLKEAINSVRNIPAIGGIIYKHLTVKRLVSKNV